jgi:hypothetical protein
MQPPGYINSLNLTDQQVINHNQSISKVISSKSY